MDTTNESSAKTYEAGFTHFDRDGRTRMVDVSPKAATHRVAIAEAFVEMRAETRDMVVERTIRKGDVLAISELAGIMGAKRTPDIIPLCHPIPLQKVDVKCEWVASEETIPTISEHSALLRIEATVSAAYQTGVEMEALTAATTAALTIYDMCKAVDRGMRIRDVRLLYKSGGKSGTFDVRGGSKS